MRADDPKRSLRILQGGGGFGIRSGIGDAIFDQEAGNAHGVEPTAYFGAFEIDGQDAVRASREDDNRGSGVLALRRVKGDCRLGHIAQADDWLACNHVVFEVVASTSGLAFA